jgi:hypothetical protein
LFVSGYERVYLPEAFLDAPLLAKPFEAGELVAAVRQLLPECGRLKPSCS